MSEKKELTRAELVRLRREKENAKRRERAKKEATRPVPTVTTRRKQTGAFVSAAPQRRSTRAERARNARRFQIALLPISPDAHMRGINLPRPHAGPRLVSFFI